jgi:hypothetical protein
MTDENLILILTYPCWHCRRKALVLPSNVVRVSACLKGKGHAIVGSFCSDNQNSLLKFRICIERHKNIEILRVQLHCRQAPIFE